MQYTSKLFTGGLAVPGAMNLFEVTGLAWEDLDKGPLSDQVINHTAEWVYGRPLGHIPSPQISSGSLGSAAQEGSQFLALPAGATIETTARVDGRDYTESATASGPLKPRIYYNGQDITGGYITNVIVGQKISLSCVLATNPSPNFPRPTAYKWNIPRYAVSNFCVSPDSRTGMVVEPFPTNKTNVDFYWVDGRRKAVSCTVTAAGAPITATTTFIVIRPRINFTGTINCPVTADTNFTYLPGVLAIHLGGYLTNGALLKGIDCVATNANVFGWDEQGPYGFCAVQTIGVDSIDVTRPDGSSTNETVEGLDNFFPTQGLGLGDGEFFSDSPGVGDYPTNFIALSTSTTFRTLLMFQPWEPSIPVPLKEILWSWSGRVATNGSGGWTPVQAPSAAISVNDRETTEFPYWTNVVHSTPSQ